MNKHPLKDITDAHRQAYERDGGVCLRGMFDEEWVTRMRRAVEDALEHSDDFIRFDVGPGWDLGFKVFTQMWMTSDDFREFVFDSPVAEIVGRVTGNREIRIMHDYVAAKVPRASFVLKFHHDMSVWPVEGEQIPAIWVALTEINLENGGMEFIAGSHRSGVVYWPVSLADKKPADRELCPDFEARRDDPDIEVLSFDMEPGDAVLFHARTVHGSRENKTDRPRLGLASRWLGDDIVWLHGLEKAPALPEVPELPEGQRPDDKYFPKVWSA